MNSLFSSTVKSGLIALGILSGVTAPSAAGPIMQPNMSIPTSSVAPTITPVRDGWAGDGPNRQFNGDNWRWRRHDGRRNWNRDNWNGGGNWNGGDDWRWRHGRRHGRHYDDGAAAILGLGLGLGLGSMYNNNNYYDGPPPRRYYRTYRTQRVSNAHVQWCYNRYRSYRAWDNTFQPYGGPRQQCWSPYS
ncbi:BA14K family protein [Mesorhizobium loti]|nr:BA14K family protein [Mesorhizobium loti]